MIYLYSGTPGSGKSLHCASVIYSRIFQNDIVISNLCVNPESIKMHKKKKGEYIYINIYEMTPQYFLEFSKEYFKTHKFQEGKILIIIDECQRIYNSRTWNENKNRNDWITFFAEHRHLGYDVILVSQNDRMIDRQIRALIEYECIHRKVSNFGIGGKIFSLFALGQLFVCVRVWYPIKEKVSSEFFKGNKRLYNFYNSYEILDKEKKDDKETIEIVS